jgi:hypothetical protein
MAKTESFGVLLTKKILEDRNSNRALGEMKSLALKAMEWKDKQKRNQSHMWQEKIGAADP